MGGREGGRKVWWEVGTEEGWEDFKRFCSSYRPNKGLENGKTSPNVSHVPKVLTEQVDGTVKVCLCVCACVCMRTVLITVYTMSL